MATLGDFGVTLVILYILECFRIFKPGDRVLTRGLRGEHVIREPIFFPSEGWGWIVLNPFFPVSPSFTLRRAEEGPSGWDRGRVDVDQIQKARLEATGKVRPLRWWSLAQFAVLFVLFPALSFMRGLTVSLWTMLPLVLVISIFTARRYNLAAKADPTVERVDRYANVIKLLLYPVAVLRVSDLVVSDALITFEPTAVAAVQDKVKAARWLAREYSFLKNYDPAWDQVKEGGTLEKYRHERAAVLDWFARKQGLDVHSLISAPTRQDSGECSYCPVCRTTYRVKRKHCDDCPGVLLRSFDAATRPEDAPA